MDPIPLTTQTERATQTERVATRRPYLAIVVPVGLLLAALAVLALFSGACQEKQTNAGFDGGLADDAALSECGVAEVGVWSAQGPDLGSDVDEQLRETNLFGVWGFVQQDDQGGQKRIVVLAAGSHGRVLRIEGDSWTLLQAPTDVQLTAIWGTSEQNVWVAGFGGVVLQYDGAQWIDRSPPYQRFAEQDGGVLDPDAAAAVKKNLWGIWVAGQADQTDAVFAVGDGGTLLLWQADAWSRVDTGGVEEDLTAVWGADTSNVFAAGKFGTVVKGSTTGFVRQQTRTASALYGVWGRGASEVYAVGVEGVVLRFDGGQWSRVEGAPRQVLRDIWGPSNDRSTTYLVGLDGALIRMTGGPTFRQGAVFDVIGCVTPNHLEGIWGTLVEGSTAPAESEPDGGGVDGGGTGEVPAVWAVGVSGVVVTGPGP